MALAKRALVRISGQTPVGNAAGAVTTPQVGALILGTDDAAAVVEVAGYFNNARAQLNKGDIIFASMANSGTPVGKVYIVTAAPKTTGNVTVALFLAVAG